MTIPGPGPSFSMLHAWAGDEVEVALLGEWAWGHWGTSTLMAFQRLPNDVIPINYKLELRPDLEAFSFQGKLDITAKV